MKFVKQPFGECLKLHKVLGHERDSKPALDKAFHVGVQPTEVGGVQLLGVDY